MSHNLFTTAKFFNQKFIFKNGCTILVALSTQSSRNIKIQTGIVELINFSCRKGEINAFLSILQESRSELKYSCLKYMPFELKVKTGVLIKLMTRNQSCISYRIITKQFRRRMVISNYFDDFVRYVKQRFLEKKFTHSDQVV